MSEDEYEGPLKEEKAMLNNGLFKTGTLVVTEERRPTRSSDDSTGTSPSEIIKASKLTIKKFVGNLLSELNIRIADDQVVELMRQTFASFDSDSLAQLLELANSSGRQYGDFELLNDQLKILKRRYEETRASNEMNKWLMIFTKKNLFMNIPDILNFALCCFVKSPLEATAETIGSVINQHGSKQRYSLKPASLSSEVQVCWNGPFEHSPAAEILLERSLDSYFDEHTKSGVARFHTSSKFKIVSKTIKNHLQTKSRIDFY